MKISIRYFPDGFGLMRKNFWQDKTFKDEISAIEWCRRNFRNIGVINNYRTNGKLHSDSDISDAIHGVSN